MRALYEWAVREATRPMPAWVALLGAVVVGQGTVGVCVLAGLVVVR